MRTIHKTTLEPGTVMRLTCPVDTRFLSVGLQRGVPCLWYERPDALDAVEEVRCINTIGTGWGERLDGWEYVGTVIDDEKDVVWHVYQQLAADAGGA